MRRGVGAFFTTGVALVGATVVVANPVAAPPTDVRIPAVKLSADSSASRSALDLAVLEAMAHNPGESGPVNLFRRSIARVVTDVTLFGGRAVEHGFGTRPPGTGTPAPSAPPPDAVAGLLDGVPVSPVAAAPINGAALQQAVTSVADYVGFVSVQAADSTVAAGRIAAAQPKLIADTLAGLSRGDVNTAIATALRALTPPLGVPLSTVKAIRSVVRKRLAELADLVRRVILSPPKATVGTRPVTAARSTSLSGSSSHRRGSAVTAKPVEVNGATDLTDGNKAVPQQQQPQAQLRQRAGASLSQARESLGRARTSLDRARISLQRLGDALRQAVPPPPPHRSHRH